MVLGEAQRCLTGHGFKVFGLGAQHFLQQFHGGGVVISVVASHAAFLHVGLGQQQAAFLVVGVGAQLGQQALNSRFGIEPFPAGGQVAVPFFQCRHAGIRLFKDKNCQHQHPEREE